MIHCYEPSSASASAGGAERAESYCPTEDFGMRGCRIDWVCVFWAAAIVATLTFWYFLITTLLSFVRFPTWPIQF